MLKVRLLTIVYGLLALSAFLTQPISAKDSASLSMLQSKLMPHDIEKDLPTTVITDIPDNFKIIDPPGAAELLSTNVLFKDNPDIWNVILSIQQKRLNTRSVTPQVFKYDGSHRKIQPILNTWLAPIEKERLVVLDLRLPTASGSAHHIYLITGAQYLRDIFENNPRASFWYQMSRMFRNSIFYLHLHEVYEKKDIGVGNSIFLADISLGFGDEDLELQRTFVRRVIAGQKRGQRLWHAFMKQLRNERAGWEFSAKVTFRNGWTDWLTQQSVLNYRKGIGQKVHGIIPTNEEYAKKVAIKTERLSLISS